MLHTPVHRNRHFKIVYIVLQYMALTVFHLFAAFLAPVRCVSCACSLRFLRMFAAFLAPVRCVSCACSLRFLRLFAAFLAPVRCVSCGCSLRFLRLINLFLCDAGRKCCLSWSWQSIIRKRSRLFRNVPTRARDSFSSVQYYNLDRLIVQLIWNNPLFLLAMYSLIKLAPVTLLAMMEQAQNFECSLSS